jgi:hypothetical protein
VTLPFQTQMEAPLEMILARRRDRAGEIRSSERRGCGDVPSHHGCTLQYSTYIRTAVPMPCYINHVIRSATGAGHDRAGSGSTRLKYAAAAPVPVLPLHACICNVSGFRAPSFPLREPQAAARPSFVSSLPRHEIDKNDPCLKV